MTSQPLSCPRSIPTIRLRARVHLNEVGLRTHAEGRRSRGSSSLETPYWPGKHPRPLWNVPEEEARAQSADLFFRLVAGTRAVLALAAEALRGRLVAARRGFLAGLS